MPPLTEANFVEWCSVSSDSTAVVLAPEASLLPMIAASVSSRCGVRRGTVFQRQLPDGPTAVALISPLCCADFAAAALR